MALLNSRQLGVCKSLVALEVSPVFRLRVATPALDRWELSLNKRVACLVKHKLASDNSRSPCLAVLKQLKELDLET